MKAASLLALLALLTTACSDGIGGDDHEWRHVLNQKRAAFSAGASTTERQAYADSLAAFVVRHPDHGRARYVYQTIQLDFARELSAIGRYRDAIRFYRAVLTKDPQCREAAEGLSSAIDHLSVSRQKLATLEKGMTTHEVGKVLGKPLPGWTVHNARRDAEFDSWYYRQPDGGVAAVHFRDGRLLAAEENSQARLSPLVR